MADPHMTNRQVQIGNICIQWSSLEYVLACSIWFLAGIRDPEVGKIVTASLDLKQRVNMAFSLAHATNTTIPFKRAAKDLQTAIRKEDLIHKRNQAVHGIHFATDRPDAAEIEMHRGQGGRAPRLQLDQELRDLGDRISQLRDEYAAAFKELVSAAKPQSAELQASLDALASILRNNSPTIKGGER